MTVVRVRTLAVMPLRRMMGGVLVRIQGGRVGRVGRIRPIGRIRAILRGRRSVIVRMRVLVLTAQFAIDARVMVAVIMVVPRRVVGRRIDGGSISRRLAADQDLDVGRRNAVGRDLSGTPTLIVLMSLQLVVPGGLLSSRARFRSTNRG